MPSLTPFFFTADFIFHFHHFYGDMETEYCFSMQIKQQYNDELKLTLGHWCWQAVGRE